MALTSIVGADTPHTIPEDERKNTEVHIYFGVFFDGTSNNMIPAAKAVQIRSRSPQNAVDAGSYDEARHEYESIVLASHQTADGYISEADIVKNHVNRVSDEKSNDHHTRTKYSNVARLHSYYRAFTEQKGGGDGAEADVKRVVYKIYVEGSGANDINAFWTGKPITGLGFGLGKTGVVALVSKAVRAVYNVLSGYPPEGYKSVSLHFDIFGFSRGSACARLFAYLIARNEKDTLPKGREREFGKYMAKSIYRQNDHMDFIDKSKWSSVTVDFLGIYDTVVSIGFLRRKGSDNEDIVNGLNKAFKYDDDFKDNYHDMNVQEYGQYSPSMSLVKSTCHICAMDEFRENFALTDIGRTVPEHSVELLIPGCHSDVGGGYRDRDMSVLDLHQTQGLEYFVSNPQRSDGRTSKINSDLLLKIGWAKSKSEVHSLDMKRNKMINIVSLGLAHRDETNVNSYRVKREVPLNYCNVPLHLMLDRVALKLKERGEMFESNIRNVFEIPDGLKGFYDHLKNTIKLDGVRKFVFPTGGYSGANYRTLRQTYLHFTSSDVVGVKLVNGANRTMMDGNKKVVCRIVYHGDKDDTSMHYMFNYNDSAIEAGSIS